MKQAEKSASVGIAHILNTLKEDRIDFGKTSVMVENLFSLLNTRADFNNKDMKETIIHENMHVQVSLVGKLSLAKPASEKPSSLKIQIPLATHPFKCAFCDKSFTKRTSLGGHVGKKHRGMSSSYLNKTQVYTQREAHRNYLAKAKMIFAETSNKCPKRYRA